MMTQDQRKANADRILYEFGLYKKLEEIGRPHFVGSYRMNMMAWNDLDIDIENDGMSLSKLHELTAYILKTFSPVWYEAKQETLPDGKTVWFHGFETLITGELFNVDLWFFDIETIIKAENYCDKIASKVDDEICKAIITIKSELIELDMYSFDKYKSIDVYDAVIEKGARNIEGFFACKK